MSDDPPAVGDDRGRSGAAALAAAFLDILEEHFVRRVEFDALRAELEQLRGLVEAWSSEQRPQP